MKQKTVMDLAERKRVFICSPLRPRKGTAKEQQIELFQNLELANLACRYAVQHGCNPMAPHLLIPGFLDDTDPEEREIGIQLGLDWLMDCDELWVIGERVSDGMRQEIDAARELGIPVVHISFGADPIETLLGLVYYPNEDDGDEKADGVDDADEEDEEGLIYDGD